MSQFPHSQSGEVGEALYIFLTETIKDIWRIKFVNSKFLDW